MIDSGCDHMLLAYGYGSKTMFFKKISSSRSEGGRLSLGTVPYMETPANLIDSTVGTCDNRPMLSFSRPDSKGELGIHVPRNWLGKKMALADMPLMVLHCPRIR